MNEPETIAKILETTKTIAVVGLSESPGRASGGVARYLQSAGYRVVPVNPKIEFALGEKSFADLDAAVKALGEQGIKIDLVDVFRSSIFVPEIVKEVMRLKIPSLWLQQGVCHEEATGWAEADGVQVVGDRCIMQDHAAWKEGRAL